jgi:hypothetical protein
MVWKLLLYLFGYETFDYLLDYVAFVRYQVRMDTPKLSSGCLILHSIANEVLFRIIPTVLGISFSTEIWITVLFGILHAKNMRNALYQNWRMLDRYLLDAIYGSKFGFAMILIRPCFPGITSWSVFICIYAIIQNWLMLYDTIPFYASKKPTMIDRISNYFQIRK